MLLLVTPYECPDLDGVACSFGYAEFLNKSEQSAVAGIFGTPHREAKFVLEKFSIPQLKNASELINGVDGVVLVDASDLRGLSKEVPISKVIEIIDHRKINEADKFSNAKVQIELVGSAATLIAEKFIAGKVVISKESAALLYSAIISNTINFSAGVTTDRDRKAAKWLKSKFSIPRDYIHLMFEDKSNLKGGLREAIVGDFATFNFSKKEIGIAQLEILNVSEFVQKNLEEIEKVLLSLKKEEGLDYVFMSLIDLEGAFNFFCALDEPSARVVEGTLKIKLTKLIAKRKGVLMRKQIVPLVKAYLDNSTA